MIQLIEHYVTSSGVEGYKVVLVHVSDIVPGEHVDQRLDEDREEVEGLRVDD